MKKVLSISMGSSSRDHTTIHEFLGQEIELSRQGMDGNFKKTLEQFIHYDGKVDAFGLGGMEFYLKVGERKYYFREARKVRKAIKQSKVGDGNGIKHILVKRALDALESHLNAEGKTLEGMKALKTTAVDRYGMASSLVDAGCDVTFGDFMFALGIPLAVKRLSTVRVLAALLLPVVCNVPYEWLYPLGSEQDKDPEPKWQKFYDEADILAGDFIQIRQNMPADLSGKIIVTNTTTARNVEELQARGLKLLVTTTPRFEGRSFGTNVMEALLLSLMDKPQSEVVPEDFIDLIEKIPLKPNLEVLN
jgi:hypothetical protein